MGYTRKILAIKKLNDKSVFYSDKFRIELAESLHIHIRNFRIEFSIEEWKSFAKGIIYSYLRWLWRGKPGYQTPANNFILYTEKINPVAGAGKDSVLENKLAVELQQFADYIHLHYRTTKYEFTVEEFLEFAEQIQISSEFLKTAEIMKDYPKRIGFYHIMQPKNRVTKSKNIGGFDIHVNRFPNDRIQTHKSLLFDDESDEWIEQLDYQKNTTQIIDNKNILAKVFNKSAKKILEYFFKKH